MYQNIPMWVAMDSIAIWGIIFGVLAGASAELLRWRFRGATADRSRRLKEMRAQLEESSEVSFPSIELKELISPRRIQDLEKLLISTSLSSAPTDEERSQKEMDTLREQIKEIRELVETRKNEIVEIQKIDPILEATLKATMENIATRLSGVEKRTLSKGDVVATLFMVLGGVSIIFAALAYAVGKLTH